MTTPTPTDPQLKAAIEALQREACREILDRLKALAAAARKAAA